MTLDTLEQHFKGKGILHARTQLLGKPTVAAYEKKFKWSWMATQMNTFILCTDMGSEPVTIPVMEQHIAESFAYAKQHYSGWPRGLQSGLATISVLLSSQVDEATKTYCLKLQSGKKWAGMTIPVVYDTQEGQLYAFQKNPMWGRVYFPYFKRIIKEMQ